MADSPHWVRDYTSGDLPVTFDASGSSRADWLQALGAGSVTVQCEDGSTPTLTVAVGAAIPGPFVRCTAMTASAIRFGRGVMPSALQLGDVDATTATASSTGITAANAVHAHGGATASGTASATQASHDHGGATAGMSAALVIHEAFLKVEAPATSKGTIADDAITANPTSQPSHPRTLDVVFGATWATAGGGDITITGTAPSGAPVTETYTGADGATVAGTKAFATIDDPGGITNSAAGGAGVNNATIQTGTGIGVANKGVGFVAITVDGAHESTAATSSGQGTFVPSTTPDGAKPIEVWYTAPGHTHAIASETPVITDAGHTHAIASATPVITVTDPQHTHSLA